jgi:hypothetical protein
MAGRAALAAQHTHPAAAGLTRGLWMIAAGAFAGAAVISVLLVVGRFLDDARLGGGGVDGRRVPVDRYTDDLTDGSGDLLAFDVREAATSYQADGFHVTARVPGTVVPIGIEAPTRLTALGVEVVAEQLRAPGELGPACWQTYDRGYALTVDSAGRAALLVLDRFTFAVIEETALEPPGAAPHLLGLVCDVAGEDHLAAYVDGELVLEASPGRDLRDLRITGVAAIAWSHSGAEWRLERFSRLDPLDLRR